MRRLAPLLALAALAACNAPPLDGARPDPAGGIEAREAPMLKALVDAGTLPPVEERLPSEPLVVTPAERLGEYGGTWRALELAAELHLWRIVGGYQPLIRWSPDASGLVPGTARAWETSADGTTLTLHLRRGLKWSDGVERTSADFLYWWGVVEDGRTRLAVPYWSRVGGTPMKVEAPDPHTVVFRFAGPNRFAALHLASTIDWQEEYNTPAHYLKRFDPRFEPRHADFTEWERKNRSWANPERPTLNAWKVESVEGAGRRVRLVRNPYFWMTDTAGRQLPYIDRVVVEVVNDSQLRVLRLLAGEVDAQFRGLDLLDHPLYLQGRKRGGYRILKWESGAGARPAIVLNWDEADPVLRGVIRDPRFRRALSLGVDRETCNLVAWRGLGRPQQATISRRAWHFRTPEGAALHEEWARSWAQYDPARANALLDEMGLTRRDGAGFRLRPDGKRLSLLVDLSSLQQGRPTYDMAEIIAGNWKALGVEAMLKSWSPHVASIRENTGEFTVGTSEMAEMDLFAFPDWVFPTRDKYWHPKVGKWYRTGGKEGEPPSGPTKELLDLYARVQAAPSLDEAHELARKAIRIHVDQGPFVIGTVGELPELVLLRENFRNVPEEPRVLAPWAIAAPATSFPESFFFADPDAPVAEAAR